MYLNKSDSFFKRAEKLLADRKSDLQYISDSIENTLSLSLYEAYSTIFGGSVRTWAIIFNITIGIFVELLMLFFNAVYYKMNRTIVTKKSSVTNVSDGTKIVTDD